LKSKFNYIKLKLKKTKQENLYRKMQLGNIQGAYITINKKKLLNFCSNDYLAIPVKKLLVKQIQSSSRLVSGNSIMFNRLEKKLAKHKSQQNALVFPTGYMANLGTIPTLIQKEDLVLSDELNHTSIIESCRLSGAKISIYKHNNVEDLETKLNQKNARKFIITEGIFSMDGDFANLKTICEIAARKNAIIILDDAHGDFTIGNDGKGTANYCGVSKKIDLYVSSLSKGLGSFGGYVASQNEIIDFLVNNAKPFIYTSALPSSLVNYSLERFNSNREKQRKKLLDNTKHVSQGLKKLGYEINSKSHIIPIIVGKEKLAVEFSRFLFNNNIFAQPIRYPTVQLNKARLRLSITAWFSENQIEKALDVFESAGKKFKIF